MRIKVFVRLMAVIGLCVAVSACADKETKKLGYVAKGDALMAEGKHADAILQYRNAIKVDPRYGDARYKLAKAYINRNRQADAAKELLRAADLLPDRADVQVEAAVLLLGAGEFEQTKKHAELALKADPKNVDAQLTLANALAGLKDTSAAVRELEGAMQVAPDDARPYATLGSLEAARGNTQAAEAAFRKAIQTDPKSTIARVALARFFWTQGRVAETEQTLKDTLSLDKSTPIANRMLALFYLRSNRAADAEAPLRTLVDAKDSGATLTLADLYARTRRIPEARALYESLAKEKQTRVVAVGRLATLDFFGNEKAKAYQAIDAVLKDEPNNTQLLALKAQWLASEQKVDAALDVSKKATEGDPNSAGAHFTRGIVLRTAHNAPEAIKSFQEALRINPQLAVAHVELARLLLARGEVTQAMIHARSARKMLPNQPEARIMYVRALIASRDLAAAEQEIQPLLQNLPRVAQIHFVHAQLLLAKSDARGAERALDKALELDPANIEALTTRLAVDVHFKRAQDGRDRIMRALNRSPDDADLTLLAGRFEWGLGETTAAERYLRATLEKDPSRLDAYTILGRMYLQAGRLDEARAEFEKLSAKKPDSVGSQTMVGMILEVQKKREESMKVYENILASTDRAPVAANNLAYIYAERSEKLDRALSLAQSAKAQLPDSPDVSDTLGWVYYRKGMAQLAIAPLEFSVRKDPKNPVYLLHLGLAYAKAGETAKARETITQALKLNADIDGAAEARSVLASLQG